MKWRWPWQTREDSVLALLDQLIQESQTARDEHSVVLQQLRSAALPAKKR